MLMHFFVLLLICSLSACFASQSLYDFQVEDIEGNPFPLDQLKGSVSLVINVASLCGFTDSGYQNLAALYAKYQGRQFHVLAFPSNEFGDQEPWTHAEIKAFALQKYDASFPMFSKVSVNGPHTHPIFNYLKEYFPGDVTWNFHGIWLVNRDGIPVHRFEYPDWPLIEASIVQQLE